MKKGFRIIGIIAITIVIVVGFSGCKDSQKSVEQQIKNSGQQVVKQDNENQNQSEQKVEELKVEKEKNLVWYKIPELGVKFLIKKEMVDLISYRDFYVQDTKADGKELYIKKANEKILFAKLILDRAVEDNNLDNYHFLSQYYLGNENIKTLITKQEEYRVCYLDAIDEDKNLSLAGGDKSANNTYKFIEELLRGYLKNAQVSLITE